MSSMRASLRRGAIARAVVACPAVCAAIIASACVVRRFHAVAAVGLGLVWGGVTSSQEVTARGTPAASCRPPTDSSPSKPPCSSRASFWPRRLCRSWGSGSPGQHGSSASSRLVVDTENSWGMMLQDASNVRAIASFPWVLSPALAIMVVVLGVNLAVRGGGDGYEPLESVRA